MAAGRYDFTCEQGAKFEKRLRVTTSSGPLDFSAFSAAMHVRYRYAATDYMIELTSGGGGIVLGGAAGTIDLTISAATTATIPKSGVYDIEITDEGGDTHRLLQGQFILDKEVTR